MRCAGRAFAGSWKWAANNSSPAYAVGFGAMARSVSHLGRIRCQALRRLGLRRSQYSRPLGKLCLSQAQFAAAYEFSVRTVQEWERGAKRPSGPARTLLRAIRADPEGLRRALAAG